MYSLITFIILCLIAYFFNQYKNQKLKRNKTIVNLIFESFVQVKVSYILVIVLLRVIKDISILHTIQSLFENRLRFYVKFNGISFIILSIILVLGFVLKTEIIKEAPSKRPSVIFQIIFMFLSMQFIMLIFYIDCLFPTLNIDQVLFTLTMPLTGTAKIIMLTSVIMLFLIPFTFSAFNFALLKTNTSFVLHTKNTKRAFFPIAFEHKLLSVGIFLLVFLSFFNFKFELFKYIKKELRGDTHFYEKNYINPKTLTFKFPEKKKNLIFIYLESTEAEISCCAKQGTNLIPELAELAKNNLSFSHSDDIGGQMQITGTGHSIASICNTHVGLPLIVNVGDRFYKNSDYFFNGAYGLGNILTERGGYNCLFVIGSETDYGGLYKLLNQHNFEVKDINYYKKIKKVPENYCVWWGIEDIKMVEVAKEELTNISMQDKPFAFSVFFEDTHFPSGYVDEECENKYPKQIHNVFANMSRRINNFVNWIKEQPFYEDTVIIILGDHLYMGDDLYDDKRPNSKRHAYNVFINTGKSGEHSKNRDFCTFDYFPTIIDCLDIKYDAEGLGLGRSLLTGKPTLLEQLGKEKLEDEIGGKSHFYRYSLFNKE
jgi:hypothetical protein